VNGRCCASAADPKSSGCDEGAATRPCRLSFIGFAAWALPSTILALMPKCPICVAAYVAVGTGLALSATSAALLRTTILALCTLRLGYLGVRWIWSDLAAANQAGNNLSN
jgi:hypothetical protein